MNHIVYPTRSDKLPVRGPDQCILLPISQRASDDTAATIIDLYSSIVICISNFLTIWRPDDCIYRCIAHSDVYLHYAGVGVPNLHATIGVGRGNSLAIRG